MGDILSSNPVTEQTKETTSTDDDRRKVLNQLTIFRPVLSEKFSNLPKPWNPAFNEFQFGEDPQSINSMLPNSFSTAEWDSLPQATEFKKDEVRYFWLKLDQFKDDITKFIPPNTTVNDGSYVCFLFIDQKLFDISIRFFYDDKHPNYDEIIEAYAKAVNTPIIETERGKEFFYDDDRIIYCAYVHANRDHAMIDVIWKGQISLDDPAFANLVINRKRRKSSLAPLVSPSPSKYDIMISYCHKDRELCHRLYYRLLEDKFRVWIDLENMYGPIVERMSEAIENSKFVLLCMSEAYKLSTYCRLEAEYAFKYQTCLIPLVVKKDFTQTGWLGMLCGLRLYVDFTKTNFDEAYEKLCTEMQRYQKESTKKIDSHTTSE